MGPKAPLGSLELLPVRLAEGRTRFVPLKIQTEDKGTNCLGKVSVQKADVYGFSIHSFL